MKKESEIALGIREVLCKLVDYYAKEKKHKKSDKGVVQGRSVAAASVFQLDFARWLFRLLGKGRILVDYPVSFGEYITESGKKRKRTCYADIMMLEEGPDSEVLRAIMELKIDLGFLRCTYYGLKKENGRYVYKGQSTFKDNYRVLLESHLFTYKWPVGFDGSEIRHVAVPQAGKNVIKVCLVVTEDNAHGRFEAFRESMEDAGFRFICLLPRKIHPNEHVTKDEDLNKWKIETKRKIRSAVNDEETARVFKGL